MVVAPGWLHLLRLTKPNNLDRPAPMNDFKAGAVLGTNPRAPVGRPGHRRHRGRPGRRRRHGRAHVTAYGPDAFGPDKSFVAAQASVVATMVSGIPSVPWFARRLYRRHRHVLARHSGHDDRPGRVPAVLHVAHGFPGLLR